MLFLKIKLGSLTPPSQDMNIKKETLKKLKLQDTPAPKNQLD